MSTLDLNEANYDLNLAPKARDPLAVARRPILEIQIDAPGVYRLALDGLALTDDKWAEGKLNLV